jgi:actin-related protein 6
MVVEAGEAASRKTKTSPEAKKRKRAVAAVSTQPTATSSEAQFQKILIIDNGGDTLKYGWSTEEGGPRHLPNVTARLQQQWTVLVGDQLGQIQNRNQLIGVTRSTERGMICNMGNQVQVWKRLLDLVGIAIQSSTSSDMAAAFGFKQLRESKTTLLSAATAAVLLLLPPFVPRVQLDQILAVWMDDFGFGRVGLAVSPVCAAVPLNQYRTCAVVDLGWSATHVVPTHNHKVVAPLAIRRVPIGGRHLINMLKYYTSYRQWNLMDQEWILRDVLHRIGFVSMHFKDDMILALTRPAGTRPFDREFVLPDFTNVFEGKVQLPPALQREHDAIGKNEESDEDEYVQEENRVESENQNGIDSEDSTDDDDEEETTEQTKQRLFKRRQQDDQRRRDLEAEQQALQLSVELFAVPEVLFRPADAGLPLDWASLPVAIVQSIEACPKELQPALYGSIKLVGGLSRLENLRSRLELELRTLVPCEYDIKVDVAENPLDEAWLGAKELVSRSPYSTWSISREEWEAASPKTGVWKRILASNGGGIV